MIYEISNNVLFHLLEKYNSGRGDWNMAVLAETNQDNFEEQVIKADQPVLVDFYTDGCGPCEALNPILEELSADYEGKLNIFKFYVSIDEVLENKNKVSLEYDVMGFPTILIFKDGEVVSSLLGGQSKEELTKEIEAVL